MMLDLVAGWTGAIDAVLKADDVAVDLSGCAVALILQTVNGTTVTLTGSVTVPAPSTGSVRFSPGAADLVAANSPYAARWKVTDGAGKIVYFPNGRADVWIVRA